MARKQKATIHIAWTDGTKEKIIVDDVDTIAQHYKQLNFIAQDGDAVAINLHATKFVRIESESFDFNDQF